MESVKDELAMKLVVGRRNEKGVVEYKVYDNYLDTSLSAWKWYQQHNKGGNGDVLYVGKIKIQETEGRLVLSLEEIDMSRVKINKYELPPYLREAMEKEKKEGNNKFL